MLTVNFMGSQQSRSYFLIEVIIKFGTSPETKQVNEQWNHQNLFETLNSNVSKKNICGYSFTVKYKMH